MRKPAALTVAPQMLDQAVGKDQVKLLTAKQLVGMECVALNHRDSGDVPPQRGGDSRR